jgi:dihydrofolate synthase/folylpolyglutamate synthase
MNFDINNDGDSLEKIINQLFSLHRFGIEPGLERIEFLLNHTDNPENSFKSIHVAGTNGKGSVSSLIASILTEAGYKTGLYTSPHLVKFRERIRINGSSINDYELAELAIKYMKIGEENNATFFEITTAIAFEYFASNKVDFAVIETGMGGRYDATNVIMPEVSIITQIDLDHQDYLGNSLEEIAYEKAGIIKRDRPVVILEQRPELKKIFGDYADSLNSAVKFIDDNYKCDIISRNADLSTYLSVVTPIFHFENVKLNLPGDHQSGNLLTALASIATLRNTYPISDEQVILGIENVISNTKISGRIQKISDDPMIVLDTAHNPAGIEALIRTLDQHAIRDFTFIFAAMKDKNVLSMIATIISSKQCKELIFSTPEIERAANEDFFIDFIEKNKNLYNTDFKYIHNIKDAFIHASNQNRPIIIAGSFYLAEEFLSYFNQFYQD